jgi:guanylate kinase
MTERVESGMVVPAQAPAVFARVERYLHPTPLLVVLSGPSGVGKDTVVRRMRECGYPFRFVVTATDRPPRTGEVEGIDYYFVSTAEFERMVAQDELFEHALVYGQHKGVPKVPARQALASGIDVIMRLDVQGAATMRRLVPQILTIFLAPPSLEALIRRLCQRASDSPAQRRQRLETALAELERIEEFDYVVVNGEDALDSTVQQVVAIIAAEKCRAVRSPITL